MKPNIYPNNGIDFLTQVAKKWKALMNFPLFRPEKSPLYICGNKVRVND